MIRVHFPKSVAGEDELELVGAVRGGMADYRDNPWNRRHKQLFQDAQKYFVAVEPGQADVIFYPHQYQEGPHSYETMQLARGLGLPLIFIRTGDAPTPVKVSYGVVYRHSIFGGALVAGERAMPAFCEDMLLERAGSVPVRTKQTRPSVGFCGYVSSKPMRIAYRLMGRRRKADGLDLRAHLLQTLPRTRGIDCAFVENDRFLGGREGVANDDPAVAAKVRAGFVESVLGSDYTLCVRGAGNFSYRFYEVLSAGRIPLYLNTDGVLPFADEVDWKKHCAWVEADDVERVGEKLLSFHQSLADGEFEQMQANNRRLSEEYLTPLAFHRRALARAISEFGRGSVEGVER